MDQVTSSAAQLRAGLQALAHPLPGGMRDLLPWEARQQLHLSRVVLKAFELHGFQQVILPAFEYADVLEQGLGPIEANSVLRFVEPETGEVVALRPDMTPQVARLVATRLASEPGPVRLSYRGSVLRRRHERARHQQQVVQAGIELVGRGGLAGDLEVLEAATHAVRRAGLERFVLDLGHGRIASSLLDDLSAEARERLLEPLTQKDQAELVRRAEKLGLSAARVRALAALPELQGGGEVFDAARRLLADTAALPLVDELQLLHRAVEEAGLAPSVVVDIGETRPFAYYTGPLFQVLAEGPGQAVGSGGRYDTLYERFGVPRPAAGFAVHVNNLGWAVGDAQRLGIPLRALVVSSPAASGTADAAGAAEVLGTLRTAEIPCALSDGTNPLDYARAWRYSHVVWLTSARRVRVSQLTSDGERDRGEVDVVELPARLLAG
ncbi:MAG: ATP phosphoribosyltransferase regulatory subunit [Myxococcales bacterium]|jgi:ATP phosphoribosyltransferase regulatory subunit|nr:ATP phosphoribosyltransferase regulatory subunit [Myxococcales bacterium]